MNRAREILEEYVGSGMLMQISTVAANGNPAVCSVWYCVQFRPDRLYFISKQDREHSANIRSDRRTAGAIVTIPLSGLGQRVRGVTFKGTARELEIAASEEVEKFIHRWPRSREALKFDNAADLAVSSRIYEISVSEWILFDEEEFPGAPRQIICAE